MWSASNSELREEETVGYPSSTPPPPYLTLNDPHTPPRRTCLKCNELATSTPPPLNHHLSLTPTVISYNNEEEDELLNLDDQLMALEIGAPQDWPQEPYQGYQPDEVMVVTEPTSFFADTSGSSSFFADPAGSPYGYQYPCIQHFYCHSYEHYGDEHYDSIGDSIHLHDTPNDPRRLHQRQHQHQHRP
ncbi:hypothetical protein F5H01DRAFT_326205 [Linnemannia elongata]|nr:hypothetical protein F5H01DRAFT_326205 [Linnemannia elongata]